MVINKYFKVYKLKLTRLDFCISKNDIIYYLNSKDYSCFSDKLYRKKIIDYINLSSLYHGINIINKARKLKIRRGKKDENTRK